MKLQVRIPAFVSRFDMAFVACAPSCVFAGILSQPASEHFGDHLDPRVLRSERVVLSLSSLLLRPDPRVSTAPPDFPGTWLYRGSSPDNLVWAAIETVPALATSLSSVAVLHPRRETSRLPAPNYFSESIGHRTIPSAWHLHPPQSALSALLGS